MKLAGILSSKGRREAWEKNNAPPPASDLYAPTHKPEPAANGVITCCGRLFTPAAHAVHLANPDGGLGMQCGAVLVAGSSDPWLAEQDVRLRAERAENAPSEDAIRRAEQVEAYYREQKRKAPRLAEGVSNWIAS